MLEQRRRPPTSPSRPRVQHGLLVASSLALAVLVALAVLALLERAG